MKWINKKRKEIISMIFLYILKQEVKDMAMVYAYLIIRGLRTYESVPSGLKEQVKQALIDMECEHLIPEGA